MKGRIFGAISVSSAISLSLEICSRRGPRAAHCDERGCDRLWGRASQVAQVLHADGAAADLVLVGGTDAAPRGADLAGAGGLLAELVELTMQRQDQRCVLGEAEIVARDLHALARRAFRSPRSVPKDRRRRRCR